MSPAPYFAHSLPGAPTTEWQRLEAHLENVAALAAQLARKFEAEDWARLAGLWHDLGKYQAAFQEHLAGEPRRVDHSVVGAALAMRKASPEGVGLALAIAGHHAGLANVSGRSEEASITPLVGRLSGSEEPLDTVLGAAPVSLTSPDLPPLPARLLAQGSDAGQAKRSFGLWTRFLFSCLVDADYLDTERFLRGDRASALSGLAELPELRRRLDEHVDALAGDAEDTPVNRARAEVLSACRRAAEAPPGFFSLAVPTGGGKTLSALSFALRHAERHGLERVIVAIPYTSIIEQNAAVYRKALGQANVIEHHASLDPERETEANRLACENWDARLVVTTNVQLFESLFANRPARCRKVHAIARSVLLLDEVQTLPLRFLDPIIDVLQDLTAHYGCSVLFSTATQPALERRESLPRGLEHVHPIVDKPDELFRRLERVEVEWDRLTPEPVAWASLSRELAGHKRVLTVVHRREDARELAQLLPKEGLFHLSALMCAAHREKTLARIRRRLAEDGPCRVVSTQLIEAGVDVDFPVVYRALAGVDSVAQAAGRCNREGRLDRGRVVVFRAPTRPPAGTLTKGLKVTERLLASAGGSLDLSDPAIYERFFRELYHLEDLDGAHVQPLRESLKLASVAERVRLIEDGYARPVVVPYGEAAQRFEDLQTRGPTRDRLRALQPFLVNVYEKDFGRLLAAGALAGAGAPGEAPLVHALTPPYLGLYREDYGLVLGESLRPDPEALMV